MDITLILSLIKLSLEVFQDERKDRFLVKFNKIEKEYQDEINKGLQDWSDLKLSQLRFDAKQLARIVVDEASRK